MTCLPCKERRREIMQAWQEKKIAEAVKALAGGVRDMLKGNGYGGK